MEHEKYMEMAIDLAKKGEGKVSPNPMVGAVIVKNGKIIGEGYHEYYGGLHAERNAIANCSELPVGSDMYVTLEPCCHYGKTPPCTEAIIASGIKRVFIGTLDPNSIVFGKGVKILEEAGIEVSIGINEDMCKKINEIFFHFIKDKTPYVVLKYAMTMDGKIADINGDSKWITSSKAREKVHFDRNKYRSIMVGVNTVIADDPMLTCRLAGGINPTRIICDTNLRTPLDSKIVSSAKDVPTIIATSCDDNDKIKKYEANYVEILKLSKKDGYIDLCELMQILGERGIDSTLLEGGSKINFSALEKGVVNKIQAYIAPKVFGGENARAPVAGAGFKINESIFLKNQNVIKIGEDILIESEVDKKCLLE